MAQAFQPWDGRLVATVAVLVVAGAAAVVMSAGPGQSVLTGIASAPPAAWTAAATASAAVAAGLTARAWAALARIPARAVLEASRRVGFAAGAFVVMDPGSLTLVAEDAHWRSRVLRSRPWPSRLRGAAAVAWLDWRRLARRPGRLALMAAATALPVLAERAGGGAAAVTAVLAAGALAVAAAGTAGARRDAGDASLARLLGTGPRALLAARAVLPPCSAAPGWPSRWRDWTWRATAQASGPRTAVRAGAGGGGAADGAPPSHRARDAGRGHALGPVPLGPLVWALAGADVAVLGACPRSWRSPPG
ncbi:DUF6297 family protein [Nocardiopsis sp. ARC36]